MSGSSRRAARQLARALLIVALACAPGIACAEDDGSADPSVLPTHNLDSIDGLGLIGTLRSQDGCIYLELPNEEVTLVFPEGYSRDALIIRDPEAVTVARIGDRVETGGTRLESGRPCPPPSGSQSTLFMGELERVEPDE